jgi:microcystin-dependent protein
MPQIYEYPEKTSPTSTDEYILQETGGGTTKKITHETLLEVIQAEVDAGLTPVGAIISGSMLSAPTGHLLCDGSAISRTTYSNLFAAITTDKGTVTITEANPGVVTLSTHGLETGSCIELTTTGTLPTNLSENTNYYIIYVDADSFQLATTLANAIAGTGIDTSGSIETGTHSLRSAPWGVSTSANFTIPDLQGAFLRGTGTHGTETMSDTNAFAGPALGAFENDQMQGHKHQFEAHQDTGAGSTSGFPQVGSNAHLPLVVQTTYATIVTDGTNGTPRAGDETRPFNAGVKFYIKVI